MLHCFFRSFLASIHCRWKVVNFTLCREYSLRFPLSLSFSNARRSRCRTMNSFYALEKLWSNFRIFFFGTRDKKNKNIITRWINDSHKYLLDFILLRKTLRKIQIQYGWKINPDFSNEIDFSRRYTRMYITMVVYE